MGIQTDRYLTPQVEAEIESARYSRGPLEGKYMPLATKKAPEWFIHPGALGQTLWK